MTIRKPKRSQTIPPDERDRSRKEADIDSTAIPGAVGAAQVNPSAPPAAATRAPAAQKADASAGATLDAIPASPPPEVLEQMARAQHTYERLARQGLSPRFAQDSGGRTTVELRDDRGQLLQTLSLAEALDLAAGGSSE
jgi:hypothetical protein